MGSEGLSGAIRPGMEVSCRVLRHLAADRWLVEFSGEEVVMQFGGGRSEGDRLQVRVVDVRPDVVLAKVLDGGDKAAEILAGMRIPTADLAEAREVLAILRHLQVPLTEENVRRLLGLRRMVADDAAAVALFLKGATPERLRGFVPVFGRDLGSAWDRLEKTLRETAEGVETYEGSPSGFFGPLAGVLGRLLPVMLPEQGRRRLVRLRRSGQGPEAEDAELVLGRMALDRVRSFTGPEVVAVHGTLFWRGGSGWRPAEVKVGRDRSGTWRLAFRTEFERLGPVEVEVVLREIGSREGRRVEVSVVHAPGGEAWAERLRRGLQVDRPDWTVRVRGESAGGGSAVPEQWTSLDLVV